MDSLRFAALFLCLFVCFWDCRARPTKELEEMELKEDFKANRTLLIDYYPRDKPVNFLFRGNMPKTNGTFIYDTLVTTMESVVTKRNLSFPSNFTLIDISYLNFFEELDLKMEEDFFRANPKLGMVENWPMFGTIVPPPENDPDLIKDIVKSYITELSHDKLAAVMEKLRALLTTVDNRQPVVIYTHCEAGTDRTGEVSGSYYMQFLNMTFEDALYIDNHIQARDMFTISRNEMQWYCYYLRFVEGYNLDCKVPSPY